MSGKFKITNKAKSAHRNNHVFLRILQIRMLQTNELGPLRARMFETFELYLLIHTSLLNLNYVPHKKSSLFHLQKENL